MKTARSFLGRLLCWLLCVAPFVSPAHAGFPAGTPVTPYLVGQNDWYFPPDTAWPTIMNSGVAIVRIGGHSFDVTPQTDSWILQQVDQIRSIGAEPLIQVSRFASLQTAVNTLTYINVTNARHVRFWSLGNEPDLNYSGTEDQLAADVATYIKQFAPALRDVDPTITIVAPDMAWYSATKYTDLLGGNADITGTDSKGRYYIDCVSFHRYGSTSWTRTNALSDMHGGFETNIVTPLLNRIAYANSLHGRSGSSALTWALTEFNLTTSNPSNNTPSGYGVSSYFNGQFFAEYYRVAMKNGINLMNTWSMLEGGGNGSSGDLGYLGGSWSAPVPRSSYYHMQMIADYLVPGGYVAAASSNANVAVLATTSSNQSLLAVMLLNEDTVDHTFALRMDGGTVTSAGDTKINVQANLAAEYAGTISQQSTQVLVFDGTGALVKRVTYSLALYQNNAAPTVENFTPTAAPTFSPAPGSYASAQTVTISSATAGASIRYTTDGSVPTSSTGTLYTGPVSIAVTTSLNAIAYATGYSDSSVTSGTYTIGGAAPAAPTGLSATAASSSEIDLTWSASAGATGYNVKRALTSGGPYTTIASAVASTSFADTGLAASTPYYYVVSAVNANGESPNSVQASATTLAATTGTTVMFEAEALAYASSGATTSINTDTAASGGSWVQLNSSGTGQYVQFTTGTVTAGTYTVKMQYKANNNRGQLDFAIDDTRLGSVDQYASAVTWPTATVGTVSFATTGTHVIRMTVTGKNASSTGYLLSADNFTFAAQGGTQSPPSAPTGLSATTASTSAINLTWTTSSGAGSYNVKRSTTSGGPYTTIASGVTAASYSDTGLAASTSYFYVVSAVNANGESSNSAQASATTLAAGTTVMFEAEALARTSSGATTSINTDTAASGGSWVQLNSSGTGQYVEFTTGTVTAGTYTVQMQYKANNNRGQLDFAIDGARLGSVDQYASAVTWPTATVGTLSFATTGTHVIRMTVTGKNASSTGYLLSADNFTFAAH